MTNKQKKKRYSISIAFEKLQTKTHYTLAKMAKVK